MTEAGKCSQCGADLAASAPGGHCVLCLLQFGLGDVPDLDSTAAEPAETLVTHGRFGRYRLLEILGEGGSGIVYRAEQLEPVQRDVALKVIKLGLDTRNVLARFEIEQQALALMDHANIARVLDAGITDSGRPFFVMELIGGIHITRYCEQRGLSVKERLELFVQVCHAVQHAHQKGVIHRDLKPSNVLVFERDGEPVSKVIDFGIAKATSQQRLTDKTIFTAFEQFIGTPAYMSPEQAGFAGQDIDTRSDIYSLGVLLYEMLTGKPPFDPESLRRSPMDEVLRCIREEEPPPPSMRLSVELASKSRTKNAEPEIARELLRMQETIQLLRGDVDCIVMKALEKERSRRYETANGLAADIERFLCNEPVLARPPSAWYRLCKLARRKRAAFLAGGTILVLLTAGLSVSLYLHSREAIAQRRAQQAELLAKTEGAKSLQMATFLEAMIHSVQPSIAAGRDATLLREVVSNTATHVSSGLTNQPEVQAEILRVLGQSFFQLGDYTNALKMRQQTLELRRAVFGNEDPRVADSALDAADALAKLGRWNEAEPLARLGADIRKKLYGPTNQKYASALGEVATILSGEEKCEEAIALERQALVILKKRHGEVHVLVAIHLNMLANLLVRLPNHVEEAEQTIRESLRIFCQLFPEGSLDLATPLADLGNILEARGNLPGAEVAWQEAKKIREKYLAADHPDLLDLKSRLDFHHETWSRDPMVLAREIQNIWQRMETNGPPATLDKTRMQTRILLLLGMLENNYGDTNRAAEHFRESLAGSRSLAIENWNYNLPQTYLGYYLQERGRFAEAEAYFRDAVEIRRNSPGSPPAFLAHTVLMVAFEQMRQGKFDEADRSIHEAWKIFKTIPPGTETEGGPMLESVRTLAHLSLITTDTNRAAEYRQISSALVPRLSETNRAELMRAADRLATVVREQMEKQKTNTIPSESN